MIGYVCIGCDDPPRAAKFYDEVFAVIGAKRQGENERYISWAQSPEGASFLLIKPFNTQPASIGNGTMISFSVDSKAKVDAFHKKAMELGGKDEGAPGARSPDFYAAFLRDPQGNKLAVYHSS